MSGPDWARIAGVIDTLTDTNSRVLSDPASIAHRDQVNSAMRTYLTGLGVDVDDPVAVHALLSACIAMQYAARNSHLRGELDHKQMEGANIVSSAVSHVLVTFVPEEARR